MDYDLGRDRVHPFLDKLQLLHSTACMILYGRKATPDNISNVLQKGVYAYLERRLIPERIIDTLLGGPGESESLYSYPQDDGPAGNRKSGPES